MEDWSALLSERLTERDSVEKTFYNVIESNNQAVQRAIRAESQLQNSSPEDIIKRTDALQNELADKANMIAGLSKRVDVLSLENIDSKKYIQQLEGEVVKAAELLKQYKQDADNSVKQVQRLKDDMLVLEIHMNVAEKKAQKLQMENSSLVDRWMQKAADEAEKMNDANAFLQSLDKARKREQ